MFRSVPIPGLAATPGIIAEYFLDRRRLGVRRDKPACLLGMKESYEKGESDSILALSLAAGIARCWSKRRQRYRWAGLLSFEKPMY